jgi:formyltetrahydrofolate-dependent phosphoribosylglycinamide formyltransferase
MSRNPLKLAILVSGSGTTLQNLLDFIGRGELDARVEVVIGSRTGLLGLKRAAEAGLTHVVVDRSKHADVAEFSRHVFSYCDGLGVDLVCLAGWLCLLDIPVKYHGRVMNIHPALLPSFGGKGMYGRRVHEAVLDHGCKVSGCTVHFVDATYDTGPIILQRTCPVLDDDTPDTLARRVFGEEKIAYPEAIRLFQQARLKTEGRRVKVLPEATSARPAEPRAAPRTP